MDKIIKQEFGEAGLQLLSENNFIHGIKRCMAAYNKSLLDKIIDQDKELIAYRSLLDDAVVRVAELEKYKTYAKDYHNKLQLRETQLNEIIDLANLKIKELEKEKVTTESFNKIADIRPFLLMHPDGEMIKQACLHFLGDKAQEWHNNQLNK